VSGVLVPGETGGAVAGWSAGVNAMVTSLSD
jgi:hypothetical protein